MRDLTVRVEKLSSLVPWGRNPRKNEAAAKRLARTIGAHGWTNPILCQIGTRRIIAGHTRAKAAALLRMSDVPVIWLDVDDQQADAIAVADNRLGDLAEWDQDALAAILSDLDKGGIDLDDLGYSPEEFGALLSVGDKDQGQDPAPLQPPTGEVRSKQGETYQLGPHRIVCGDCRDPAVVEALFAGARAAVAVTSPPYASQRTYDPESGFVPIPPDSYVEWFNSVQSSVLSVLAADGSWFVNIKEHCDGGARSLYVRDLVIAHVREWGWRFVDELVWYKKGAPGRFGDRFRNDWEPVFHFSRGPCKQRHDNVRHASTDIPKSTKRSATEKQQSVYGKGTFVASKRGEAGLAYPGNVLEISTRCAEDGELHPAAYPTRLPAFLIAAYSDPGDIAFDPFMGGGSTLIAADSIHRVAYGCEISPAYCDLIRRRWTKHAEQNGLDPGPGALIDADA